MLEWLNGYIKLFNFIVDMVIIKTNFKMVAPVTRTNKDIYPIMSVLNILKPGLKFTG